MPGPLLVVDAPRCSTARSSRCRSRSTAPTASPSTRCSARRTWSCAIVADHDPRAVVICFGAEAAHYRVELYPPYHADRPPVPRRARAAVGQRAASSSSAFGWTCRDARRAGGRRPARLLRARRGRGRRQRAAADRRPRHVPVRRRPRDGALPEDRRPGRRVVATGRRCEGATASRPSSCRTSSRCAATPPTGCRAPRASARRRRPTCCAATARSRPRSPRRRREAARRQRAARAGRRAARLPRDRDASARRRAAPAGSRDRPRGRCRCGGGARHAPARRAPAQLSRIRRSSEPVRYGVNLTVITSPSAIA